MTRAYIVAGGTGGHINAALSIGEALESEFKVIYITGKRPLDLKLFKNKNVIHVNAKPLRGKGKLQTLWNICVNVALLLKFIILFISKKPNIVIGAGGYVCGPPLLASKLFNSKIYILEQNSVMGMTNKLLAAISDKIFTNFSTTKNLPEKYQQIVLRVGNPVRSNIKNTGQVLEEKVKILIFGGSLGAKQINDIIPSIINQKFSRPISIIHQTGETSDNQKVISNNENEYQALSYIDDMNEKYHWANLLITRAGASTLTELAIIQKPSVLIPYPQAVDDHQTLNARSFSKESDFYVSVIDSKLKDKELAEAVILEIEKIINKGFESKSTPTEDAVGKIKNEVLNDNRI